jgi:hypothetical protein
MRSSQSTRELPAIPAGVQVERHGRVRRTWSAFRSWAGRAWAAIRPGPEARRGAAWGCLGTAGIAALIDAIYINLGWGLWFDFAFCLVASALIILMGSLLVRVLLFLTGELPRSATALMVGSCLVIILVLPEDFGPPVAITIGLLEGLFGAAIATLLLGGFRKAALAKKIITVTLLVLGVVANVELLIFLRHDGTLDGITAYKPKRIEVQQVDAPNPASPGAFNVKTLTYGSGTDRTRTEYGPSAALKTNTVDASKFFRGFHGWKRTVRRWFWGFDVDKLPLNAHVWYPDGAGPFPLVLIVHGNHSMTEPSELGYTYLGELLASRGFIVASIDENFLNSGLFHRLPGEQPVRGWLLLEHLKLWRDWKDAPGNPFCGKVDFERIAVIGHSRGGEAAATAALFNRLSYYPEDATIRFDYGFPIRSVVGIAPDDGHYRPTGEHRTLQDVSYLIMQGGWDADVSWFRGSRQYDYVRYTHPGPSFKSELWIYRANHGQFNTVWGRKDTWGPLAWFLNVKPLMSGEDQRSVARVYIAAFLEATLRDRREYIPLFRHPQAGREWLPEQVYLSRFEDASYQTVAAFNEDPDLTTTTLPGGRASAEGFAMWREGRIPLRLGQRDYNGLFLGWNRKSGQTAPWYQIDLPGTGLLTPKSVLDLSVAQLDEDPPGLDGKEGIKSREALDFTIELETVRGEIARQPVSLFGSIAPPLNVRFTKLALLDEMKGGKATETVLQSVTAPLSAFGIDPTGVKKIRFRFDRTPQGAILISRISAGQAPEDLSILEDLFHK